MAICFFLINATFNRDFEVKHCPGLSMLILFSNHYIDVGIFSILHKKSSQFRFDYLAFGRLAKILKIREFSLGTCCNTQMYKISVGVLPVSLGFFLCVLLVLKCLLHLSYLLPRFPPSTIHHLLSLPHFQNNSAFL